MVGQPLLFLWWNSLLPHCLHSGGNLHPLQSSAQDLPLKESHQAHFLISCRCWFTSLSQAPGMKCPEVPAFLWWLVKGTFSSKPRADGVTLSSKLMWEESLHDPWNQGLLFRNQIWICFSNLTQKWKISFKFKVWKNRLKRAVVPKLHRVFFQLSNEWRRKHFLVVLMSL